MEVASSNPDRDSFRYQGVGASKGGEYKEGVSKRDKGLEGVKKCIEIVGGECVSVS